jgi:NADH-quinone oxidoreductase subunit M
MNQLHLPWLELAVALPLVGALFAARTRDADVARKYSLLFSAMALALANGAWLDFNLSNVTAAGDRWNFFLRVWGVEGFTVDAASAPLLPLVSLLCFLTNLSTLRTKVKQVSFSWSLVQESLLLATLSCRQPWAIIALLSLGTLQPWIELRKRGQPTRVYTVHMAAFVALLVAGQALVELSRLSNGPAQVSVIFGVVLLMAAVLLRSGAVPVHCWMTDLFEHATFGTALLFVTPMVGAYAAVRLVLPIAPVWALSGIALVSLITAVYASGMALVQREARRFFCYLFLSHSSLVLVGLEIATPAGLTGALCVWISVGLCMTGFGLTLRSVEARTGRLSLAEYHGLYEHAPTLAAFFLLTGLASIGYPGTVGFVGTELLIEGAVLASPIVGAAVVVAAALNSLAVVHGYFRVFTGKRHFTTIDLRSRLPERVAVLVLTLLILGGGVFPQPGVASRYRAAAGLIAERQRNEASLNQRVTLADEQGRASLLPDQE